MKRITASAFVPPIKTIAHHLEDGSIIIPAFNNGIITQHFTKDECMKAMAKVKDITALEITFATEMYDEAQKFFDTYFNKMA